MSWGTYSRPDNSSAWLIHKCRDGRRTDTKYGSLGSVCDLCEKRSSVAVVAEFENIRMVIDRGTVYVAALCSLLARNRIREHNTNFKIICSTSSPDSLRHLKCLNDCIALIQTFLVATKIIRVDNIDRAGLANNNSYLRDSVAVKYRAIK
jgi:hypothetical protein